MEKQETTYYRFLSEVRAFLAKLIKEPIKADISKYLKDRDFTKSKLIKDLMSRDVLERHEKILDSTNSEEKTAKYVVKYKVKKKDFENKIHKIYIKYFEKNEPEKEEVNEGIRDCGICMGVIGGGKPGETAERWADYVNKNDNGFKRSVFKDEEAMKKAMKKDPRDKEAYEKRGGMKELNEEGEGGDLGGTSCFSVGGETTRGDMGYDVPMGMINRPAYNANRKGKKGEDPTKILGKTITAEGKKTRTIRITEEQYNMIMEMGTGDAGAMGDYTANGLVLKTSDGKEDPCAKAGKIKVKTVMK